MLLFLKVDFRATPVNDDAEGWWLGGDGGKRGEEEQLAVVLQHILHVRGEAGVVEHEGPGNREGGSRGGGGGGRKKTKKNNENTLC
jgi:hypothetical protein